MKNRFCLAIGTLCTLALLAPVSVPAAAADTQEANVQMGKNIQDAESARIMTVDPAAGGRQPDGGRTQVRQIRTNRRIKMQERQTRPVRKPERKKRSLSPRAIRREESLRESVWAPGSSATKAKLTSGTSGVRTGIPEYKTNLAIAKATRKALRKSRIQSYHASDN